MPYLLQIAIVHIWVSVKCVKNFSENIGMKCVTVVYFVLCYLCIFLKLYCVPYFVLYLYVDMNYKNL